MKPLNIQICQNCCQNPTQHKHRRTNNGVSRYPSYQKKFQLVENSQKYLTHFVKMEQIFLEYPLYLQQERHGRMWQRAYRINLQRDRTTLLLIKLSFHCFIYLFIYSFIYLLIYLFIYLFLYLCLYLFLYFFISLFLYIFISLFLYYLYIYLFNSSPNRK